MGRIGGETSGKLCRQRLDSEPPRTNFVVVFWGWESLDRVFKDLFGREVVKR